MKFKMTVGLVLAGPTDWKSFIVAFIWLELHLLAFDVRFSVFSLMLTSIDILTR